MIFLLDSIELWLSSNRNILQFFSFLSNSLIKPNLLQEPCFHNSHKTLKFVYGLWLLMRSFFLNLFLIFQLHSLMFRIVQLIINQALYRACTGIVSYHLSLKWLLCFQTALFHKIFFELVRGRKMYFSLHLELSLFSWKYKKDFFALEKLQGMNIYISKWGYYSKTKKIITWLNLQFHHFILLSGIFRWTLNLVKISIYRNWNFKHSKKITRMWRRWGLFQNFCLTFIDELEEQLFIEKTIEVGR